MGKVVADIPVCSSISVTATSNSNPVDVVETPVAVHLRFRVAR